MPRATARDAAPCAVAALLALLALPATGIAGVAWLPSTPGGYRALALVVTGLLVLALGAAGRHGGPRRPLLLALAAAPALVFGSQAGGGPPGLAWVLLLAAVTIVAALPRARPAGVAVLVGALALAVVFDGSARARMLGESATDPAADAPAADAPIVGLRVGAPVPLPEGRTAAFGFGRGPWWLEAERASRPGPRPLVLLMGGGAPKAATWSLPEATLVEAGEHPVTDAHDLRPFDAVVVIDAAWGEDDGQAEAKARAVERFVRGGGLLLGPAPDRRWPPRLGPLLGAAGRARTSGVEGVRRLGLGRVARAANQGDVAAIFAADLWVRDVGTSLLDPRTRPLPPATFTPWRDDPGGRRTQGWLLLVHALALLVFTRLLRGGTAQLLGTFLVGAAVAAGLAWTTPLDPGFRVEGAFVDLGGAGGRRIEAVWISAGPEGFRGRVRFEGEGVLGRRGGLPGTDAEGRLGIAPGRSAWIVRETRGLGDRADEREDRTQAPLLDLLRGDVVPARVRLVRRAALPVRVEGWGAVPAGGVIVRGADR